MSNYLHAIAVRLKEAALELERHAGTAKGGQESLWAKHLHEDAKSTIVECGAPPTGRGLGSDCRRSRGSPGSARDASPKYPAPRRTAAVQRMVGPSGGRSGDGRRRRLACS
jgi:hypothetical protein